MADARTVLRIRTTLGAVQDFALVVRENLDDLRPAWAVVVENIRRRVRRNFNSASSPEGPWDALRPRTVRARRRGWGHYARASAEGPTRRILHWTQALRKSVTEAGAEGSIVSASASTLIFGTSIPYAGPNNRTRPFLVLSDPQIVTDVVQPVQQYLLGRSPALGQGRRRTRRISATVRFAEASD